MLEDVILLWFVPTVACLLLVAVDVSTSPLAHRHVHVGTAVPAPLSVSPRRVMPMQ